ncbi:hypothetical protein NUJ28_07105 [Burkholderia multivorans]|nr:hypothetical protein [Burkholderia multivorans]UXZ62868.1 hypothetical protein NUJ28_07105 [Burkholderia multivorans]
MNDQQHSSADALTDEQIFAIADELPDFFVKQYELDVLSFARRLLATTDERASALYDSAYCAGLKAGFSLGDAGDNDGLSKALESRRGYVEVLRNPRAASTVEQPAAAPTRCYQCGGCGDNDVAPGHCVRCNGSGIEPHPVEQPAAAPIDTPTDREFALSAAICVHPKGVYGDEGGSMCCPITHTRDASFAPSPADERAAFVKLMGYDRPETEGVAVDVWDSQRATWLEALAFARAASANDTGAEGAAELESMTRMFHAACHDLGLINEALGLDPDDGGAEPILDAIAELRAQIASAQTDEPVAWAVYNGWSRICFYMTEEDARDHAQKAQKNHDLSGSLAAFRVVPLYAARAQGGES